MSICKNCLKEHSNGSNFCTRKCRMTWIKSHEIKGAKKRYSDMGDTLLRMGITGRGIEQSENCGDHPYY